MHTVPLPTGTRHHIVDVDGYVRGGQVWIFCPHEHRWHRHGRGERAVGLVSPHCTCETARREINAFRIRKVGEFTDEVRRAHPRERRRCATCSASAAAVIAA